ncbi:MFS transporter [Pseudomonas canadensis]|uniref:Aromatic acid/H+ symport family MFS transporter n=1 Tax=Pseudomonas canadensis TaxID=915099 RepID=A0ABZ1A2B1_9PSED|nr:aromatic acid/H+ symport family MFS transporter [Pseudomonas canadensis]WRI21850.1 aromatic acid/H+ symport family MFS transporter [Pseudomonas canadensis]
MLILAWCSLVIAIDGYDLAVAGVALPSIMKSMDLAPTQAGLLVSSALFGMLFGNLLLGTLSEKIGRPKAVALCVILFSVFTALAGLCASPWEFAAARFIAGIGIGGMMPNVVAVMTEIAPQRKRSIMVTLMFSGHAAGGIVAAIVGKQLIEDHGWPSVFIAAGLPVLLVPFLLRSIPESIPYLIKKGRTDELAKLARNLSPTYIYKDGDTFFAPVSETNGDAPFRQTLSDGRRLSTVMFWLQCFMCLFMIYSLSSWLTKLMADAGYSGGSAMTFVLLLNVGGVTGSIIGGLLGDRFKIKHVLIAMYLIAAASLAILSFDVPTWARYILVMIAGATTIGSQIVGCAYAGQFYPAAVRATGVGWMLGMGRLGAILAPIMIGVLMSMSMSLQGNFLAIALPGVLAALAVALINHSRSANQDRSSEVTSASKEIGDGIHI